jgi:RNA polymerase-binding transcription factor DksA
MKASVERIREDLLARRRALIEQVAHVEDDLHWLDTNVGKRIPVRRLEALPTADRCVGCAKQTP